MNTSNGVVLRLLLLTLVAVVNGAASTMAATWDGNGAPPDGDGKWTTAANWNPDGVPSGVSADINLNGADVVLDDGSTQTIAGMQLAVPNNVTATLGVTNSVINVNGGFSMATGGTTANATLTLNGATLNGISGGEWVRRGGTATVNMTNSTVNFTNGAAWAGANAPEGADTLNLSMTNSTINLSSGSLSIGSQQASGRNDQKVNFTIFDASSQINIAAGGININGGNPTGPAGQAVYNLPLAAATGTAGKIFARNGVNNIATSTNSKVTLTLDAAGTAGVKQSDPVLNWNGSVLNVATQSATTGIVNLTGMTLNNVGGSEWARRGGTATVNMVNSTVNFNNSIAWAGGNAPEGADTLNLSMTNSKINVSSGNLSIGNARNDQKVFFSTFDGTSQINIDNGGISLNGGNPAGPSGYAVYNLPLADASGKNGMIYARSGVFAVATANNAKVTLTLDAAGTSGVKQSDPVLNWNGNALSIATGGNNSDGVVNLTGMTLNNVAGSNWARRGGTATLNMTNSTIHGNSQFDLASFSEGTDDLMNLNMVNSVINVASGGMNFGGFNQDQRVKLSLDSTSQINLPNGGMSINGGEVSGPGGFAVYTLPLTSAGPTNGKINLRNGIQVANSESRGTGIKVEVNITDSGPNASAPTLSYNGSSLNIATGGGSAGAIGRLLIDDVDISGVSGVTLGRRGTGSATLSIKDATFTKDVSSDNFYIGWNEGSPRGELILDNGHIMQTSQSMFNRHGTNAAAQIKGKGSISITNGTFFNDGRVVADGGDLTISASGGVASQNFAVNQSTFGTAGWFAVNGGKLTLPGLTSIGTGKTWGEDPNDTTPDLVNSVRFNNVVSASGTLNGSVLASNHPDLPLGLTGIVSAWDFDGLAFNTADMRVRYDEQALTVPQQSTLKLWHHNGTSWVDITSGAVDTGNKWIDSSTITSLDSFAVALNSVAVIDVSPDSVALPTIIKDAVSPSSDISATDTNNAPGDYNISSVTGNFNVAGAGTNPTITAGGTNTHAVTYADTSTVGNVNGSVMFSDGTAGFVNGSPVTVALSGTVLDHADGEFGTGGETLTLDFGTLSADSGIHSLPFEIQNLFADFRAGLDLDSISEVGDNTDPATGVFSTDAAPFTNLAAGDSNAYDAFFDTTGLTGGPYSATFLFNLSDEDLPGAIDLPQLTLQLIGQIESVAVVPEPQSIALWTILGVGLAFGVRRIRRKRG